MIGTAEPMVICDDREAQVGAAHRAAMDALASGSPGHVSAHRAYVETLRDHRNRDGGFRVAAVDPLAAEQALTGTVPADRVRAAALLSDGASRLVDPRPGAFRVCSATTGVRLRPTACGCMSRAGRTHA